MNAWIILVTYYKNYKTSNVSQTGYKTYEQAKKEVLSKINEEDLKVESDYRFLDLENEIQYELKSVFINNQ